MWHGRTRGKEDTVKSGRHDLAPIVDGKRSDITLSDHAGIVDERVDPADFFS